MIKRYEELLKKKKVKNSDVSRATGISPSTLSEWKSGKYQMKADKIQLIADYFGVSVDYILKGEEMSIPEMASIDAEVLTDDRTMAMARIFLTLEDEDKEIIERLVNRLYKK